jgi:C1A family cysteine protease
MKKPTVLRLWAVLCTVVILSACQKETSQSTEPVSNETNEYSGPKLSGVIPDDPAKVAKVPTIMSQEFLSNTQKYMTTPDMLSARGKPVKSGTDATPPIVNITSPTNGSSVSGTVIIQVNATDNIAVASISLSVDGTIIGTSNTAPYSFSWTASNGSHTIVATAKDAAGNSASNSISVSQNVVSADVTAPTVSITSPASGSSVSGTVNVSISASDNVGIKSVALSVDGIVVSSLTAAPYNFSWNTTNLADGNHSLSAKATDAAGNVNTSTITVAKNTTITTLPSGTLPSSVSLSMPAVGNQGSEGCCVSFAVGYAARSSEQYYQTGASSYSLSTNTFSPEFLYNQTKFDASCTSGSSLLTALDFLKYVGICTWQTMPYTSSNGCSLLPTSTQNSEAAKYKITSYSSIYTTDITAIKTMLASKHPLVISFSTDQNFYNAGPGFIWKSYSSTSGPSHAVAICGYDDAKHAVKIINSWGTSWGDSGYTWIDYDFLPQLNPNVYVMKL